MKWLKRPLPLRSIRRHVEHLDRHDLYALARLVDERIAVETAADYQALLVAVGKAPIIARYVLTSSGMELVED